MTYHVQSFYQLIRHGYVNVKAVTQEDEVSEVLNGSLHNSIVNNLQKKGDNFIWSIWNLQGLDILPIIALQKLE